MAGQGICMHGVSLSQNCHYCDSERGMDKNRKDRREPVQPFKCTEHGFQTMYRDRMIKHFNQMHKRPANASKRGGEKKRGPDKDRRKSMQPYKCPEHGFQTPYRDTMIKHLNQMHNRPAQASARNIDKFLRKAEKKRPFLKFW